MTPEFNSGLCFKQERQLLNNWVMHIQYKPFIRWFATSAKNKIDIYKQTDRQTKTHGITKEQIWLIKNSNHVDNNINNNYKMAINAIVSANWNNINRSHIDDYNDNNDNNEKNNNIHSDRDEDNDDNYDHGYNNNNNKYIDNDNDTNDDNKNDSEDYDGNDNDNGNHIGNYKYSCWQSKLNQITMLFLVIFICDFLLVLFFLGLILVWFVILNSCKLIWLMMLAIW